MNNQVRKASVRTGRRLSAPSRIDGRIEKTTPTGIAAAIASRSVHHSSPHHLLKTYVQTATDATPKKNARRWKPGANREPDLGRRSD
jgi:hypothetical protein